MWIIQKRKCGASTAHKQFLATQSPMEEPNWGLQNKAEQIHALDSWQKKDGD